MSEIDSLWINIFCPELAHCVEWFGALWAWVDIIKKLECILPKENDLKISGNGVTKELKSLFKNSVCQPQTTLKNAPQLGSCYATVFFQKLPTVSSGTL